VLLRESWGNVPDFVCGLANNFEIANDRILNKRTFQKSLAIEFLGIGLDARDGDDDMLDVVADP
jgi:hypothetical protein